LQIDARIADLAALGDEKLALQVAMETDSADWSRDLREDALLRAVSHLVELHGSVLTWDDRGIRLMHGRHSLVLGVPAAFARYIDGAPRS
jgi:hypothetical protein